MKLIDGTDEGSRDRRHGELELRLLGTGLWSFRRLFTSASTAWRSRTSDLTRAHRKGPLPVLHASPTPLLGPDCGAVGGLVVAPA